MADRKRRLMAMTAAAQLLEASRINEPQELNWQKEAWQLYDLEGALYFAAQWMGNALSRVRLFAASRPERPGDEPDPIEAGSAVDLVAAIGGGVGGTAQLMKSLGIHLTVPGIGYLVADTQDEETSWQVYSSEELRVMRTRDNGSTAFRSWEVRINEQEWKPLPAEFLVTGIRRPHERHHWLPDSPARHALRDLWEAQRASDHIEATLGSRLAGNGLLIYPSQAEFPAPPDMPEGYDAWAWQVMEVAKMATRDPRSPAAKIPLFSTMDKDLIEKIVHLKFDSVLDAQVVQLRSEAIRRAATAMDMPAEVLLGMGEMNHWCTDQDTEILTRQGWRLGNQILVGQEVLTLNHETGLSEWQPIEDIYSAPVIQEPMISMQSMNHDSLTTLKHRWPTIRYRQANGVKYRQREWTTSEALVAADRITIGAPCGGLPTEVKYSDALVELVAWLWTDGSVYDTKVAIRQSHTRNPERVVRIRAALYAMLGSPTDNLRGLQEESAWKETILENRTGFGGPLTVFTLNKLASEPLREIVSSCRRVGLQFIHALTKAQLELFVNVSCMGDGRHWRQGKRDIWQRYKDDLLAYEMALVLLGSGVSLCSEADGFAISELKKTAVRPAHGRSDVVKEVPYTGIVWCPVTANGTWFARRYGKSYYTGNSAWLVAEEAVKFNIVPNIELIVDGITKGYLQPALNGADDDAVVWYDLSELTAKPDKSANTMQAYDRLEASGNALRRDLGLSEGDAPEADELREMVIRLLLKSPLTAPLVLSEVTDIEALPIEGNGAAAPMPTAPESTEAPPEMGTPAPVGASMSSSVNGDVVVAAAYPIVRRALEVAGNRLRQKTRHTLSKDVDCPPEAMHTCVDVNQGPIGVLTLTAGAWASIPEMAQHLGWDATGMTDTLEAFTGQLLETGQPLTWDGLSKALSHA